MNLSDILHAAQVAGMAHNHGAGGEFILCATQAQLEAFAERLTTSPADQERFTKHTEAVAEFLKELYAIMVNPCAEGSMTVKDMQAALIAAALQQREQLAVPAPAAPRPTLRQTHTVATMDVSQAVYDEIAAKLRAAGYDHVFSDGMIDMSGIGLVVPCDGDVVRVLRALGEGDGRDVIHATVPKETGSPSAHPMRNGYLGSTMHSSEADHSLSIHYATREQADAAQEWLADGDGVQPTALAEERIRTALRFVEGIAQGVVDHPSLAAISAAAELNEALVTLGVNGKEADRG